MKKLLLLFFPLAIQAQTNSKTFVLDYPMLTLRGGCFMMGCDTVRDLYCEGDETLHRVCVEGFKIGKEPVSQALWEEIMGYNPSHFNRHPTNAVERVSWEEVQLFIEKLNQKTGKNYRLPTEAEWEFAARGGNESQGRPYGHEGSQAARYEFGVGVNNKNSNEIGLVAVSGTFWQWCADAYKAYPEAPSHHTKSIADKNDLLVVRGASWYEYSFGKLHDKEVTFIVEARKAQWAAVAKNSGDVYGQYLYTQRVSLNGYRDASIEARTANRHYSYSESGDVYGTYSFRLAHD